MIKLLCVLLTASAVFAVEPTRTLLVLGDSIAAGYGLDQDEAYPAILQQKIDRVHLPYRVVNAGVSGDTTAGGLRRISWLLRQPVDVLLIELGGNDGLRGISPNETEKNLQGIIDKVKVQQPAARIVITGMQMPPNMGQEYAQRFREVFAQVAKKNHAALIPFLLEGVGGHSDLNQTDRIHPTAEGHKIIADTIWKALEPILNKKSRNGSGTT